jgi:hypothetical protein
LAFGELILVDKGCPKLNLQIRADNKEVIYFYKAVGYDEDKVISFDRFNSRLNIRGVLNDWSRNI